MMAAIYQLGYRLAMLCAGAGALYIADFVSWRAAYLAMAGLMVVGIGGCLLSPRLDPPARVAAAKASAFGEPLADLVRRYGATLVAILALVAIYRLPDFVSGVMANPLYIDLGFSKSDIATVSKLYGVWIGMAGAFGGGIAVARLGRMPSLLIGGFAASASHLTLAYLAASGAQLPLLTLSVSEKATSQGDRKKKNKTSTHNKISSLACLDDVNADRPVRLGRGAHRCRPRCWATTGPGPCHCPARHRRPGRPAGR